MDFKKTEKKWQDKWEKNKIFKHGCSDINDEYRI